MKKGYSLLALPLVAVVGLAGCGKTERSVEELTTLDAGIISEYAVEGGNTYFNATSKCIDVTYSVPSITTKVQTNTVNAGSNGLDKRYYQLGAVYDRTLTMAYSYYAEFKDTFYASIGDMEYEKDELSELYDRLKAFERQLAAFNTSKLDFEREVNLFTVNGEVLGATIDAFNTHYTEMIGTTLELNNYFRDLHVKYFYPANAAKDASYATRAYMDGVLTLANYVYKDYLVALEKNGTTNTTVLFSDSNNLYTKLDSVVSFISNDVSSLKDTFLDKVESEDETVKTAAIANVTEYEVALNTFKLYFDLYEKVYDKVDMEKHNAYRFNTTGANLSESKYLEGMSTVDAANVRVLLNIEEDRTTEFVNALTKLVRQA